MTARKEIQIQIKENIAKLIEQNKLAEVKKLIERYKEMVVEDIDVFSIESVVAMLEGDFNGALDCIEKGLAIDKNNFDLRYNLAYLFELQQAYEDAGNIYRELMNCNVSLEKQRELNASLERVMQAVPKKQERKKMAFFVKMGMDSFIDEILRIASTEYEVRKVLVDSYPMIDEQMEWADVCWFEWCDELVIYGSRLALAKRKKIICRLHSYEAFTTYPEQVEWDNVDKVIFVAEHIRMAVLNAVQSLPEQKTVVVPNGIDLTKYNYKERTDGFKVAYLGYINYKKGPMLLLHTFAELVAKDSRYQLYMAGIFQDAKDEAYFNKFVKAMKLTNNVIFQGWQDNVDQWLDDKNYILCTSILEGHPVGIMQAMAKGIKPIIHNFVGAKGIYPSNYIWNTMDEAVELVCSKQYESQEYRAFIEKNYRLTDVQQRVMDVIKALLV